VSDKWLVWEKTLPDGRGSVFFRLAENCGNIEENEWKFLNHEPRMDANECAGHGCAWAPRVGQVGRGRTGKTDGTEESFADERVAKEKVIREREGALRFRSSKVTR
jgi:hypothetical protein